MRATAVLSYTDLYVGVVGCVNPTVLQEIAVRHLMPKLYTYKHLILQVGSTG